MPGPQEYKERGTDLIEAIRMIVQETIVSGMQFPITGTVKSVNTGNQTVQVQPEGERSELLDVPLRPIKVDGTTGIYARPTIGTTVRIGFYNGDLLRPYIDHVQDFDEVIMEKTGVKIHIKANGDIETSSATAKTTVKANGDVETTSGPATTTVKASGEVSTTASGPVNVTSSAAVTVSGAGGIGFIGPSVSLGAAGAGQSIVRGDAFKNTFDNHTHPSNNAPPSSPMPGGDLNTKCKVE